MAGCFFSTIGKTVVISGFVYREDDMASSRFVVSRMVMSCCRQMHADA
ncbi:hypothetical protein [Paenibacillus sp. ATY16]